VARRPRPRLTVTPGAETPSSFIIMMIMIRRSRADSVREPARAAAAGLAGGPTVTTDQRPSELRLSVTMASESLFNLN
jgi:hypothetical protein